MSSKKDGIMLILSSPSGAGKTTLAKKISSENNFFISISHTTRKPRANEINGSDYFFVSNQEFEKLIIFTLYKFNCITNSKYFFSFVI